MRSSLDRKMFEDFSNMMADALRTPDLRYHALVLYSGGKDSNVLLSRIVKQFPLMRILALSVDNSFMSPLAVENINKNIKKYPVDHLYFRPSPKFLKKMYRKSFMQAAAYGCAHSVDMFDGDLIHDIAKNIASEFFIPIVLSGLSPVQVEQIIGLKYFCKTPEQENGKREKIAGLDIEESLGERAYDYFWNPSGKNISHGPRLLYPFYVWGYNEDEIKEEALKIDIKSHSHPVLTNNRLIPLMTVVDILNLGYSSYEPEFSALIRSGKANRKEWVPIFELSEYGAKTGRFIKKSIDPAIKTLELDLSQIIKRKPHGRVDQ